MFLSGCFKFCLKKMYLFIVGRYTNIEFMEFEEFYIGTTGTCDVVQYFTKYVQMSIATLCTLISRDRF